MSDFYSSAKAVRDRTGVQPADLGQYDDDELDTFIEGLLTETSDLMNRTMGRDYLADDDIPAGLHGIAADITAESIRTMVATRQTPVVRIDDFAVRTVRSTVLSPDIRARLRLYGSRGLGAITLTSQP